MEWFYYKAVISHTKNKLITPVAAAYQPFSCFFNVYYFLLKLYMAIIVLTLGGS